MVGSASAVRNEIPGVPLTSVDGGFYLVCVSQKLPGGKNGLCVSFGRLSFWMEIPETVSAEVGHVSAGLETDVPADQSRV